MLQLHKTVANEKCSILNKNIIGKPGQKEMNLVCVYCKTQQYYNFHKTHCGLLQKALNVLGTLSNPFSVNTFA